MTSAARIFVRIPLRRDVALDRVRAAVEALGREMGLPSNRVLGAPNPEDENTIEFDAADHAIEIRWDRDYDPIDEIARLCVALEPLTRSGFHTCWSNVESSDLSEYNVDSFYGPTEALRDRYADAHRIELAIGKMELEDRDAEAQVRFLLANRAAFAALVTVVRHAARMDLAPDVLQKRAVAAMDQLSTEPPAETLDDDTTSAPAP